MTDIPIENNENYEVKSLLVADDIVLYMASQKIERATDEISKTLHNLNIYFHRWKIKINAQNCESIIVRPSGKLNSRNKNLKAKLSTVTLNNAIIPQKISVKYLVVLQDNFKFYKHMENVKQKTVLSTISLQKIFLNKHLNNSVKLLS